MKQNTNFNENEGARWVNQVLGSLDGIERAQANPFLYTRILSRIQEANSKWEKIARYVTKPTFAIAATTIFLALNMWVVLQQKSANEKNQIIDTEHLFAIEYNTMQYSLVELSEVK